MKSVLYRGCTVNAYMSFHGEHILSFSPRPKLPLSPRPLSFSLRLVALDVAICAISRSLAAGSANESARRRAFTAFLRYGGGCGRLGLLPPQRSYCFNHPNHLPPDNHPGRATIPLRRLLPPGPSLRTAVPLYPRVYFLLVVRLPIPLHPSSSAPRTRERPTASYGTVLRILMDRLRNCWRN